MAVLSFSAVAATGVLWATAAEASLAGQACNLPPSPHVLTVHELAEGESAVECDVLGRDVTDGELTLTIPPPGHGVWQDNEYSFGSKSFAVLVDLDGTISYSDAVEAPSSSTVASTACTQNGYALKDAKMAGGHWAWWLGDGQRPARLTTAETEDAIRDFLNNITQANNDCGRADNISASLEYDGVTTFESDFHIDNGESKCGDGGPFWNDTDNTDTIDFGNLDDNGNPPLATTCLWTQADPGGTNLILEADVRFNTTDFDWTNTGGSDGCSGYFDLRHVGTHEAGHVFGLGHADADTDPWLTMRQGSSPCTIWKRTLGLGDMLGLEQRY